MDDRNGTASSGGAGEGVRYCLCSSAALSSNLSCAAIAAAAAMDSWQQDADLSVTFNKLYYLLSSLASLLSMLGSGFLCAIYVHVKRLRSTGMRLLVYLSIADFLTALGNLVGIVWHNQPNRNGDDLLCRVQSAWTVASSVSSFSWSVIIAVNVYAAVASRRRCSRMPQPPVPPSGMLGVVGGGGGSGGPAACGPRLGGGGGGCALLAHSVSWGLPVTISAVAWSQGALGLDECSPFAWWCWVRKTEQTDPLAFVLWQLFAGKAWEIAANVTVTCLYLLVKLRIGKHVKSTQLNQRRPSSQSRRQSAFNEINKKLTFVPLVFVLSRLWGTLRFLLNISPMTQHIGNFIAPIQGLGDSSQGFLNCIVFVYTTRTIRRRLACKRTCQKKQRSQKKSSGTSKITVGGRDD